VIHGPRGEEGPTVENDDAKDTHPAVWRIAGETVPIIDQASADSNPGEAELWAEDAQAMVPTDNSEGSGVCENGADESRRGIESAGKVAESEQIEGADGCDGDLIGSSKRAKPSQTDPTMSSAQPLIVNTPFVYLPATIVAIHSFQLAWGRLVPLHQSANRQIVGRSGHALHPLSCPDSA